MITVKKMPRRKTRQVVLRYNLRFNHNLTSLGTIIIVANFFLIIFAL